MRRGVGCERRRRRRVRRTRERGRSRRSPQGARRPEDHLIGHSYGTYLALAALRAHGASIERAVLIATAGPNHMRKLPHVLDTQLAKRYNQAGVINLMTFGMRCSGGATAKRDEEIRLQAKTSILGNALNSAYPEICAALPPVDPGDAFRAPIVSNVPVLFVSGTLDSNTPPYQAEEVRWGMPRASHLIVQNAGHEDLEPNEDVQP